MGTNRGKEMKTASKGVFIYFGDSTVRMGTAEAMRSIISSSSNCAGNLERHIILVAMATVQCNNQSSGFLIADIHRQNLSASDRLLQ